MNNLTITKVGTIIYALVIAFFGINHFINVEGMQNTVPRFIPGHLFWVYLTGIALIAAAASILTGKYTYIACLLLAIFLLAIVLTIHLPAILNAPDEHAKRFPMANLLKDTAMGGAALIIAGLHKRP